MIPVPPISITAAKPPGGMTALEPVPTGTPSWASHRSPRCERSSRPPAAAPRRSSAARYPAGPLRATSLCPAMSTSGVAPSRRYRPRTSSEGCGPCRTAVLRQLTLRVCRLEGSRMPPRAT